MKQQKIESFKDICTMAAGHVGGKTLPRLRFPEFRDAGEREKVP